jgi:hypothetical protein
MTSVAAEIPTERAALAFADQVGKLPSLDSLFAMLEGAGISIGIEGRLRVFVLLSRLSSLGVQLDNRADLLAHLMPVLAGSAHEQDEIRRLAQDWIPPDGKRDPDPPAASKSVISVPVERLEQLDRRNNRVVIGVAGAIVLLLLGIVAVKFSGGASPGQAATDVATASHPVVSICFGVNPYWKPVIEDGLSRLAFAAAVLIAGLSLGAWRREAKGRLVRQVGDTDLVSRFRLVAKAPRWFRTIDARTAFDRLKRVRWRDTDNIDARQTILKTIRGGGRPTIEYKRLRELPNYVLLIDRSAQDDYAGLFARTIEGALIDARIVYSRYDFSGVPDRLNPVRGGEQSDIVDAEYLPFSVVASRHAGERLVLVGTGTEFFEVPGIRVDRSGRRAVVRPGTPLPGLMHIREFASASLITSAPVSAWGDNERQLADVGFAIFPAEVKGIEDLAARIIAGPEADEPSPVTSALPGEDYILKRLDRYSQRFMSEVPPHREEIDQVVGFLKTWAGSREVYALLAAIAAFPKIEPEFTFVLAKLILTSSKGEIDSALFGRLIRLPWIRDGYMPDWLRIAIINGLQEDERDDIRRVQASMMKHVETGKDEPPALDELVATFEVARQLTHGQLNELTARIMGKTGVLAADERIFFSVLNEEALDPIDDVIRPEAPEIVADRMDRPERRRRFWMRAMVLGVAVLAAWTQPWLWRLLTHGFDSVQLALKLPEIPHQHVPLPALFLMLIAILQWSFNVMRSEPRTFTPLVNLRQRPGWSTLISIGSELPLNPQISAIYACASAFPNLLDPIFTIVALSLLIWVSIVTPERWWNRQSAETMLPVQLQRDVVTGSLGTLAVVAVWAIPWFHGALPLLSNIKSSIGELVFAAIIGAAGMAASNALMRRWVIGKSSTFSFDRCWLEFGFGVLTALLLAAFARFEEYWRPASWTGEDVGLLSIAAYYLAVRSTLGITQNSLVWRLTLNVALSSTILTFMSVVFLGAFNRVGFHLGLMVLFAVEIAAASLSVVILVTSVIRLMRRNNAEIASRPYPARQILLLATICLILTAGWLAFLASMDPASVQHLVLSASEPRSADFRASAMIFWLSAVPMTLLCWPTLRLLGLLAQPVNAEPVPWQRAAANSPWWAVPAMWLAAIGWHFGDAAFSVWPLALPIGMLFAWQKGPSATTAIAVGTLPLVLRLGDGDNIYWTPGGVWPALAVMFWAHFVTDASFRQRLLRRESLPWLEAFALALLLAVKVVFKLPPNGIIPAAIQLDPSWMLATVAIIVGASRMPLHRLAIALVLLWPFLQEAVSHGFDGGTLIGIYDIFGSLMLLYAARAWRRYAAIGAGISPKDPATGLIDRRILKWKNSGSYVAGAAIFAVGVLVTGWIPDGHMAPAAFSALALTTIAGLLAADFWLDRYSIFPKPFSIVPLNPLLVGFGWFAMYVSAGWGGKQTRDFEVHREVIMPPDLKAIGFAVCCVAFLAFGHAIRIVAERRSGESWRDTTRRIWRAPQDPDKPTETPDVTTPDRDEDIRRAVA